MEQFNPEEHLAELKVMIEEATAAAIAKMNEKPKVISADDFVHRIKMNTLKEFAVVDVREPDEYAADNISGINIPLGEIETRANEVPRNTMVVVHCRSGRRSEQAIDILKEKFGFDNLYNLEGGLNAVRGISDCPCINNRVKKAAEK